MSEVKLSVVVPTRNRPDKLRATLARLAQQIGVDPVELEVIVVDDGSSPPVTLDGEFAKLVRLEGQGRSTARNRGADTAAGQLLVFVDDDMLVQPGFLAAHWHAHAKRPGALQVGSVRLPEVEVVKPFGRFRQRLEDDGVPNDAGPVKARNFCTAQNMAIERHAFEGLQGFDAELSVAEDQDLALRHTQYGGEIVFVPEARAVHDDHGALTLESYCDRAERYMEELAKFGARHPDWPDTIKRARVNGPISVGGEPLSLSAKKVLKDVLMWRPVRAAALRLVSLVERAAPDSRLLDKLYRIMLGAHLRRGYRRGLRKTHA